jgi:hypothetical protein
MMTSARKPTAGFWITVALVAVLVGYASRAASEFARDGWLINLSG